MVRGRRLLTAAVLAVGTTALLLGAGTDGMETGAAETSTWNDTSAGASTSPEGAHVRIGFDGAYWEEGTGPAGGGSGGGGTAGGCVRRWVPETGVTPGVADYLSLLFGPAPSPEHVPYSVYCGDAFVGAVWIAPGGFTIDAAGPTAAEIAAALARDLPYPEVTVGVNPDGRGLTGLESWFWIDGYDGRTLGDAVSGLGATVEVEATPTAATWDFGDGTGTVAAPVASGPDAPAATHRYERRSDPNGFTVTTAFSFSVRYRVDGGAWIGLPPVEREAVRTYAVVESRAQLVPDLP